VTCNLIDMAKPQIDPLRVQLLEMIEEITDRSARLRDYATTPGNAWLAQTELLAVGQLISELEALLEEIKQFDAENGY